MNSSQNFGGKLPFGWDLLYRTVEKDLTERQDILMLLLHFMIIKETKFRCSGCGDSPVVSDDEIASELLPPNWNNLHEHGNKYSLRYIHPKKRHLFVVQAQYNAANCFVINVVEVPCGKVNSVSLDAENTVQALQGKIYELIPCYPALVDLYRTQLIEPMILKKKKKTVAIQVDDLPNTEEMMESRPTARNPCEEPQS